MAETPVTTTSDWSGSHRPLLAVS